MGEVKMKIDAKLMSNIFKIAISIVVVLFNVWYIVLNKQIAPIDQQISLFVLVGIVWSVWLPVDASIFIKNLKDLKELAKK